jgi:hypothetical protein
MDPNPTFKEMIPCGHRYKMIFVNDWGSDANQCPNRRFFFMHKPGADSYQQL